MSAELSSSEVALIKSAARIIEHSKEIPVEVLDLLLETFIGTNGAQYKLLNTIERVAALQNPHFFFIRRNGKAIANVTICERKIKLLSEEVNSFYIRYFAFQSIFQGANASGKGANKFHFYFKALFNSHNLNPTESSTEKSVYWAFIDPENLRSFKMREKFGLETIGEFRTYIFHRFFPKKKSEVVKANEADLSAIKAGTTNFYTGFNFLSLHRITAENYYLLNKGDEIVAGIKVYPSAWKIKRLPGKNGKLLQKILPLIPLSKRLIKPNEHLFLASEGLWYDRGLDPNEIAHFLEGVLAINKRHSLFIWEDDKSNHISNLKIKWGLMQRIKKDNPIHIVAKFNNYSENEIKSIKVSPKYLSGFDMT